MVNIKTTPSSNVVIVVPVYKRFQLLTDNEVKLLKQIQKVFFNRDIRVIIPKSLEENWNNNSEFETVTFSDIFFVNQLTYSKLLCCKDFYERFNEYEYLQIIQTDCWIFEDKLDFFANLDFDYIGAPWMVGGFYGKPQNKLWTVGNGGFSLRKVNTFLSILDDIKYNSNGSKPVFKYKKYSIKSFLKNRGFRNNLRHYVKDSPSEDIFWCVYVPKVFSKELFRIADTITASHYSFEVNPTFLYNKVTTRKLPMGCHNWMNNEPLFWSDFIDI